MDMVPVARLIIPSAQSAHGVMRESYKGHISCMSCGFSNGGALRSAMMLSSTLVCTLWNDGTCSQSLATPSISCAKVSTDCGIMMQEPTVFCVQRPKRVNA